jgi:hypothetical protein
MFWWSNRRYSHMLCYFISISDWQILRQFDCLQREKKKKKRTISTTQVCYFLCSLDEQLGLLHRLKGRKKAWHTRWSYQISQIWPYSNLQYYPHEPFWLLKFSFSLLQILCCFPSMIFRVAALFTLFHCTWLRCCNFTIHGKSRK